MPVRLAWSRGADLPVAVSEVAVAAVGTDVHVLGGWVGGRPHSTTHLVLDTRSGRWRTGPPLPAAVDHVAAAVVGDTLYAIGGYGADGRPTADGLGAGPERGLDPPRPAAAGPGGRRSGVARRPGARGRRPDRLGRHRPAGRLRPGYRRLVHGGPDADSP